LHATLILFWLCMDVKGGGVPWVKKTDWQGLRTRCWEGYLVLRQRQQQEVGENCIMMSFITCVHHEVVLWWSDWISWHRQEQTWER